jgi:SAM-dependent methyltransferase
MSQVFSSAEMAAGYARSRPPVHPRVVERMRAHLRLMWPVRRALDVGCGSGLSTAPLLPLSQEVIGVEPVVEMLRWAASVVPGAFFLAGQAEFLPLPAQSIDLATAAGSLNYAGDLSDALKELRRVLRPSGHLVVYDFGQGKDFVNSPRLRVWHDEFSRRYPLAPARALNPDLLPLAGPGFQLMGQEDFTFPLPFTAETYLGYTMTESNVAAAVARGESRESIRAWCRDTLADVFGDASYAVQFTGYLAYAAPL